MQEKSNNYNYYHLSMNLQYQLSPCNLSYLTINKRLYVRKNNSHMSISNSMIIDSARILYYVMFHKIVSLIKFKFNYLKNFEGTIDISI
jgi:hypothetical protein